jgi:hypothetical protein
MSAALPEITIEAAEEVAEVIVPGPVEVIGEVAQGVEFHGQGGHYLVLLNGDGHDIILVNEAGRKYFIKIVKKALPIKRKSAPAAAQKILQGDEWHDCCKRGGEPGKESASGASAPGRVKSAKRLITEKQWLEGYGSSGG